MKEQEEATIETTRRLARIQALLRAKGWSGRALAEVAGVSPGTAASFVRGEIGSMTDRTRLQIAQAFDWNNFEAMLDGTTIEPPPQYRQQKNDASFYESVLKTLLAIVDTHPDAAKRVIRMALTPGFDVHAEGNERSQNGQGLARNNGSEDDDTNDNVKSYGRAAMASERQLALA